MKLARTVTGLLSVALLAFMATDVLAQDSDRRDDRGAERGNRDGERGDRGRGGPGGDRGRGGPGGDRGRGGPGGDPTFGLLLNDKIKEEIELMPDQEEALGKIREQSSQRDGDRPNFDFREASEEDRRKFFEEMQARRAETQKKIREQLEEVLLPQQLERLEQIVLQMRGIGALGDDKVAEKLAITEDQKKKLEEKRETIQSSMRERMQDPKMRELFAARDREAIQKALAGVREDFEKQMLDVLTSKQKQEFETMKGEPFEMPEGMNRGFGGGPGFGGRGGPGGDRRGGPGGGRDGQGGDRRGGGDRERTRPALEE